MANKLSEDGKQIERNALMEAARKSRYCAHIWRAVDKLDYYEDTGKYLDIEKLRLAASGTWGYVAIKEIVYDFKYSDIAMPENYNNRRALLEQRTLDELSIFRDRQELQPPHKIVEAAYEIVSKQDIEMSLRENDSPMKRLAFF